MAALWEELYRLNIQDKKEGQAMISLGVRAALNLDGAAFGRHVRLLFEEGERPARARTAAMPEQTRAILRKWEEEDEQTKVSTDRDPNWQRVD